MSSSNDDLKNTQDQYQHMWKDNPELMQRMFHEQQKKADQVWGELISGSIYVAQFRTATDQMRAALNSFSTSALHRILTGQEIQAIIAYISNCKNHCQAFMQIADDLKQRGYPELYELVEHEWSELSSAEALYKDIYQSWLIAQRKIANSDLTDEQREKDKEITDDALAAAKRQEEAFRLADNAYTRRTEEESD